jgi:16S rRNA (cytosine1402-N4)-methyltransferase
MNGLPEHGHEPVMVAEVLEALALPASSPQSRIVMDCTLGRGGHSLAIAQLLGQSGGGTLIGLDVDPENLAFARKRIESQIPASVELRTFHADFSEADDVLEALNLEGVDGLLADFGVSTNQLLDRKHGLSFNADLPLDMRLDPRTDKNAADLVREWSDKDLARIFQDYAQERFAWRIARKIIQTRATEPILTTGQLARLVRSVVPPSRHKGTTIDPATRTFQALRMAVNSELESIEDLLASVPNMMNTGGRAVFISFHSGEDRLVKQATRQWESEGWCDLLNKKPLEPGEKEQNSNPRSRSAKLRAVVFNSHGLADMDVQPGH